MIPCPAICVLKLRADIQCRANFSSHRFVCWCAFYHKFGSITISLCPTGTSSRLRERVRGCQTEVSNLHAIVGIKENIHRLQIAMNHPLAYTREEVQNTVNKNRLRKEDPGQATKENSFEMIEQWIPFYPLAIDTTNRFVVPYQININLVVFFSCHWGRMNMFRLANL